MQYGFSVRRLIIKDTNWNSKQVNWINKGNKLKNEQSFLPFAATIRLNKRVQFNYLRQVSLYKYKITITSVSVCHRHRYVKSKKLMHRVHDARFEGSAFKDEVLWLVSTRIILIHGLSPLKSFTSICNKIRLWCNYIQPLDVLRLVGFTDIQRLDVIMTRYHSCNTSFSYGTKSKKTNKILLYVFSNSAYEQFFLKT